MKLILKKDGTTDLRAVISHFNNAPDGYYSVEIKKIRKKRSNDQNA